MKRPSLLLLDDATFSLDAESRSTLLSEMRNRNRITIIVMDRVAEANNADKIFAINRGSIIESGTHEQLIKQRGYCVDMCKIQEFESAGNVNYRAISRPGNMWGSFWKTRRSMKRSLRSKTITTDEVIPVKETNVSNREFFHKLFEIIRKTEHYFCFGIVATIISEFWIPCYVIFLGEFSAALKFDEDRKRDASIDLSIKFVVSGCIVMIVPILSGYLFGKVASHLS